MTKIIAHRGASFEAPENTLRAIKRAVAIGVHCIEMDLHITKDGIPVVIHDSSLLRTTNIGQPVDVEDLTLEELKRLDAGSWFSPDFAGEKIPTLQEVLDLDRGDIGLMLEVKKGKASAKALASKILPVLPKHDPTIILGSFGPEVIESLQHTPYGLIGIVEEEGFIETFLGMGIKHFAIWSRILNPRLMNTLKENGVRTWIFTVDDVKDARFLMSLGVDGIITNNPALIQKEAGG